jgi:DNA mismatch repair ATPase MutS
MYLKKVNTLANNASKTKDTFKQYALLLKAIEAQTFQSQLVQEQQKRIQSEALKASQIFSKFSKALDALDNRNNLISAVLANGYLLWDLRQTYNIEQWIQQYADKVADWFDVVTFFDTYNSLGNYAFNHKEFIYPEITNATTTISAEHIGHPLLNSKKRVNSDLLLQQRQFFIVTGANMAGKSTFLRTVALHIVMANIGLPVCAKKSTYKPIKLITSMRTTDSLTDDSSYFFSELTRLKFVVDTIEKDTNYFVILDEILKGTNSTDKAIGSRKFVERLVGLNATGIIATHDLSLTEIESELSAVKNYYFDAEIINEELHFDYKLKQGVCQNMNASFLLKKMEIV